MQSLQLIIGCFVGAFVLIFVLMFIERWRGTSAPNMDDLTAARTRREQE